MLCLYDAGGVRRQRELRKKGRLDNEVEVRRAAVLTVSTETYEDPCVPWRYYTDVTATAALAAARRPYAAPLGPVKRPFEVPPFLEPEPEPEIEEEADEEEKEEEATESGAEDTTTEPGKRKKKKKKKKKKLKREPTTRERRKMRVEFADSDSVVYAKPRQAAMPILR